MTKQTNKDKTSQGLAGALSAFQADESDSAAAPVSETAVPAATPVTASAAIESEPKPAPLAATPVTVTPAQPTRAGKVTARLKSSLVSLKEMGRRVLPLKKAPAASGGWPGWLADSHQRQQTNLTEIVAQPAGRWAELSVEEAGAMSQSLTAFLNAQNFEPEWLKLPQLPAEMAQSVERAAVLHSLAFDQMARMSADLRAFGVFRAWQKNPEGKTHQALFEQLFVKLVEAKKIAPPPADLFLAPDKERQTYITQMVNRAALEDSPAVLALLKELLG